MCFFGLDGAETRWKIAKYSILVLINIWLIFFEQINVQKFCMYFCIKKHDGMRHDPSF